MAKIDLSKTKEAHTVNSRSAKKVEHEKAVEILERAKRIKRKVIFIKQGEGQFSRELKEKESPEEMLISRSAAEYLMISYNAFARRQEKIKLPFIKKKGKNKYFKISDLDKFKNQLLNC